MTAAKVAKPLFRERSIESSTSISCEIAEAFVSSVIFEVYALGNSHKAAGKQAGGLVRHRTDRR